MVNLKTHKYYECYHVQLIDDESNSPVGRCVIETSNKDNILILWSVAVLSNQQKKGYGTQLVKEAVSYYEKFKKRYKSNRSLVLYVFKNNIKAINLYKKNGFQICGDYNNDAYIMKYVPESV